LLSGYALAQSRFSKKIRTIKMSEKLMNPPIGLSRGEAAEYVGLSPNTFDELVQLGIYPKPLELGIRRRIWHRKALELAMDRIANIYPFEITGSPETTQSNTLLKKLENA